MAHQATLGAVLIALGVAVGFLGTVRSERAYVADEDARPKMLARMRKLRLAILVIAAAVAFYLLARKYGHGLGGLRISTGVLIGNALVVGALKIRAAKSILESDALARFKRYAAVEAAGFALLFAGIYVYLTR